MKTQEELEAIKAELKANGTFWREIIIPVDDEGEKRTIFLKRFDERTIKAMEEMAGKVGGRKATEVFITNTYLGGDEKTEIFADFEMMRSLEWTVVDLTKTRKAEVKKN